MSCGSKDKFKNTHRLMYCSFIDTHDDATDLIKHEYLNNLTFPWKKILTCASDDAFWTVFVS